MSSAVLLVKNLFKLGIVALQYSIVWLNLDTHSSVLSKLVKSEVPKVEPSMEALHNMSISPTKRKSITMESDAPPYVGNSDNIRAFSHKDKDELHEWLP